MEGEGAQEGYISELTGEREELKEKFGKTASSIGNRHLRWRMAADIEQMEWRIDYLKKATSSLE
jgi:hypothetical protein